MSEKEEKNRNVNREKKKVFFDQNPSRREDKVLFPSVLNRRYLHNFSIILPFWWIGSETRTVNINRTHRGVLLYS